MLWDRQVQLKETAYTRTLGTLSIEYWKHLTLETFWFLFHSRCTTCKDARRSLSMSTKALCLIHCPCWALLKYQFARQARRTGQHAAKQQRQETAWHWLIRGGHAQARLSPQLHLDAAWAQDQHSDMPKLHARLEDYHRLSLILCISFNHALPARVRDWTPFLRPTLLSLLSKSLRGRPWQAAASLRGRRTWAAQPATPAHTHTHIQHAGWPRQNTCFDAKSAKAHTRARTHAHTHTHSKKTFAYAQHEQSRINRHTHTIRTPQPRASKLKTMKFFAMFSLPLLGFWCAQLFEGVQTFQIVLLAGVVAWIWSNGCHFGCPATTWRVGEPQSHNAFIHRMLLFDPEEGAGTMWLKVYITNKLAHLVHESTTSLLVGVARTSSTILDGGLWSWISRPLVCPLTNEAMPSMISS